MDQNITTLSGIVDGFERTTQVSGNDQQTRTTHLSIFKIGSERVILQSSVPGMMENGDNVAVAGISSNGQFTALACKNLTTGWLTPLKQQGCVFAFLICFAIITFFLFFLILPPIAGIVALYFAYKVNKYDQTMKTAHEMIKNA